MKERKFDNHNECSTR